VIQEDVQKYIDDTINPGLAMHGGYLTISEFNPETMVLKIEMGGGCHGCASSKVTLKLMIDNALRDEFPSLTEILDVTDHNIGMNPYYV